MSKQDWLDRFLGRESKKGRKGEKEELEWHAGWILQPGQVLVNNYRVKSMIGSPGGMGQVYVAEDISLESKVAIKVPVLNILLSPEGADLFLEEARKAALLRPHPHIVLINACLTDPRFSIPVKDDRKKVSIPFIVMEYLGGGDLAQRLRAGPMPFNSVADLFEKICLAVHYAHNYEYERKGQQLRGIIHRDLKPENICFHDRGRPVVVDFGLARVLENPNTSGGIVGTPTHMAPEQWNSVNYGKVDHRADIYALGVILYQMITGQLPYSGDSIEEYMVAHLTKKPPDPRDFRSDTPLRVVETIQKALEKEKEARFDDAKTLADKVLEGLDNTKYLDSYESVQVQGSIQLPAEPFVPDPKETSRQSPMGSVIPASQPLSEIIEESTPLESRKRISSWIELKPSGQIPPVRAEHTAVWDEDQREMYVIGSSEEDYQSGSPLWVYKAEHNSWQRIAPSGSPPPGSHRFMAVLNSAARKIYAFGSDSFHPDDRVQYGMWVYEINTNSWEVQEIHLELTDLSRSSAVWDSKGNRIIVFGGRRSDGIKNNRLIVYDDYNCIWENVRSAVDAPPVRDWHSAVWDPNEEKMYIFGGVGSSNNYYNDLWVYTPSTKYWNLLDPSGVLPPPLVAHSAAWDEVEGNMYVFGGKKHSYLNHNDIWKYNAAENAWKHLPMIGQIPEARSDHTAVWSTSQRIMYIFGGVPNNYVSPSQLMNDLWEFNPEVTPKIHEMQA